MTSVPALRHLPPVFLAYPSEQAIADSMKRLADELRSEGATVTTWQELKNPGFLFDPIAAAIDAAGLVLAETTFGNANVLFELGYAIARGKATFQLENKNAARPRKFPPLEPIRHIPYEQRADIVDFLKDFRNEGTPLADNLGLRTAAGRAGAIYFVPSRRAPDINQTLWSVCDQSLFVSRTIDQREVDYDNLTSQGRAIAEAEIFATILVNEETKEFWDNNAQLMLLAGLAHGLGNEFVVFVQQPLTRLLDLGEHQITFVSETEAGVRMGRWLSQIAGKRLTGPAPKRQLTSAKTSPFATLFIGHLDARTDFDLDAHFFETPEFRQAESGQKHLFVGSKGSGKTANYETLKERLEARNVVVVCIAPQDFEFPRLVSVFEEHLPFAHWQFVYGSFWRFVFLTEILRAIHLRFLDHLLRDSSSGKTYATELLKWLSNNEKILSMDFVTRVSEVLSQLSQLKGSDDTRRRAFEDLLEAARMYDIERHLKTFGSQFDIRLLVDDLDRNWSPTSEAANRLILAMLNEIHAIMSNQAPHLKPSVFIRKDVFSWLKENDPELVKRDPAFLRWTADGLEVLIASRIARQLKLHDDDPADVWDRVFPKYTRGQVTRDFIFSRTLLRPRDIIQFCQKAVEFAQRAGRETVDEQDIYAAWDPSGELLAAQMETEYSTRYPGLGLGVLLFLEQPVSQLFSALEPKIKALAEKHRGQATWLDRAGEDALSFIHILYETGFVGVETAGGTRWFDAERGFEDISRALSTDFSVIVHPAFHRYLRCYGA